MKSLYKNPLRMLVKAVGTEHIQDIAKEISVHPNTITNLIRPEGPVKLDTAQKLAAHFGYRLVITLEPLDEGKK